MKTTRQQKILELIESREIETQGELAACLQEEGYPVTQATVSRDIRSLGLKKKAGSRGTPVYTAVEAAVPVVDPKYIRILKEGLVSMEPAMNLLVLKTVPGMAMAAGAALDSCAFSEIVGCIAGDDTILCVMRTVGEAVQIKDKIQKLVAG